MILMPMGPVRSLIRGVVLGLALFALALPVVVAEADWREGKQRLSKGPLTVFYDDPAGSTAREVADMYPELRAELISAFGWPGGLDEELLIVLLGSADFQELRGTTNVVALASAREGLVVMDLSRAMVDPEGLRGVLKHELAHIYIGRNIKGRPMPRWLNEGLAQWASGGVSELLMVGRSTELARAVLLGRLISLRDLERGFPQDSRSMRLAYQESRSMVEFIIGKYGHRGLGLVLEGIRQGKPMELATSEGLSVSWPELQQKWLWHLKRKHTLMAYISNNIYTVLFVLAALVTVLGFVRMLLRYRAYGQDETDDDDDEDYYKGDTY